MTLYSIYTAQGKGFYAYIEAESILKAIEIYNEKYRNFLGPYRIDQIQNLGEVTRQSTI